MMRSVHLKLVGGAVAASLLIGNVAAQEPSAAPNPGFPPCVICGGEDAITIPAGAVSFPGIAILDCQTVEDAGLQGFIDPEVCSSVIFFLDNCGCAARTMAPIVTASPVRAPISLNPTNLAPTGTQVPSGLVPTDSPAPSPNPTDTRAPSPSPSGSPRPTPSPTITEIPSKFPTESPGPSPAPSFNVTPTPSGIPTESPQPSPQPSGINPTRSPTPSLMPSAPDTPSPSEACGIRDEPCTIPADCCSFTCQQKPGQPGGTCLSSKTASKNDVKLGNDKGGAGNQSKRQ